ncbi:MAG: PilW family protein [Rhodanobacter sp.]|jgi:type IV pilus assembly protein PilW|nr:PilW family protein [Rhodanobacter sp.]
MNTRAISRCRRTAWGAVVGFSLIEIMIAMTLGLLLSIGIVSFFININRIDTAQQAMALLQENGRYAIMRIVDDLRSAGGQYCSNNGGDAQLAAAGIVYHATQRSPMVYTPVLPAALPDYEGESLAPMGWASGTAYPLSPHYFIQGYRCTSGKCIPAVPTTLPGAGTASGSRAKNADVLTLRSIRAMGWPIVQQTTQPESHYLASITMDMSAQYDNTSFGANDLALIADCSSSRIVSVDVRGTGLTPSGNFNDHQVIAVDTGSDARVFNFSKDFRTVTYYLRIESDSSVSGRVISSLRRRVNGGASHGGTDDTIVEGVERMDILYGVESDTGATYFLTADAVDSNSPNLTCPPLPSGFTDSSDQEQGCLWRAVKSVEVSLLLDTVNDMSATPVEQAYFYGPDNSTDFDTNITQPEAPASPTAKLPSGLPSGSMLRREFRILVSVRNSNP